MSSLPLRATALAVVLALPLAAGAASGGVKDKKGVPKDHAIYAIGVNINTADPLEAASAFSSMVLVSVGDKPQTYTTKEVLGERNGTLVFTGFVPPGKYRIFRLATTLRWAPLGEVLGTLELQGGRVNVLGLVLIQPAGQRYYMTRQPLPQSAIDYLRAVYAPYLANHQPESPVIPQDWPAGAAGIGSLAQRNAPFTRSILVGADGTVVAPAKVGQVVRLETDETWVPRPTGAQLDMISIAPLHGGGYIAGGEFGAVRRTHALHTDWQDLQLPAGEGGVHAVAEAANGDLYAVSYHGLRKEPFSWAEWWWGTPGGEDAAIPLATEVRVWKRAAGQNAWALARELPIEKDHAPLVFGDGRSLLISVRPFTLDRLDVDTAVWDEYPIPVDSFTVFPGGVLSGVTTKKGPTPQYSRDGGRTWSPIGVRDDAAKMLFKPSAPLAPVGPGIWVATGKLTLKGKNEVAPAFMTEDDGRTWKAFPDLKQHCWRVAAFVADGKNLWIRCATEQVFGWNATTREFSPQREFALP